MIVYRFYKRGWKLHLHLVDAKDDFNEEVNSQALIQSDLDKLYTGPEIDGFSLYAQYFTNLWTTLMYSVGMPLLYPIAMVYFMFLYWINKILILKSYRKTSAFNQDFALVSIEFYKIGLLIKVFMGLWMISSMNLSAEVIFG